VKGVAKVGETLTAEITPSGATVNYQWLRSDSEGGTYTNIIGATTKTYKLDPGDFGKWIKVKATGTGNYKGTVESKPVGPVDLAEQSTYKLTYTGLAESYIAGDLIDVTGKTRAEINAAVKEAIKGLEPVKVTLATDVLGRTGYKAVRIFPVGAGDHIQLWAKDTSNNWYDINVTGWGALNGFELPAAYDVTTEVFVLANKAGDYQMNIKLVDLEENKVIAETSGTIKVVEAPKVAVVPAPGVSPENGVTVEGVQEFTFRFKSVTGELQELELDIYLGDNTGPGRKYDGHLGINLPAASKAVEDWIDQVVEEYEFLPSKFHGLLAAAGYVNGVGDETNKQSLKQNIFYTAGTNGEGTWTLKLDMPKLGVDKIEFLVAVKDDKGAQWGNNNFVKYPDDVKAYLYNIKLPVSSLTMSAANVNAITGKEFSMAVTAQGTVVDIDKEHMVRFYGVIPGLSASDIVLIGIPGGTPAIVSDATEREYVGASENDLVLAWGPSGGFPLNSHDYSQGVTTVFKAKINNAGNYTVTFVFYDLTAQKQLNGNNEKATITVTDPDIISPEIESATVEKDADGNLVLTVIANDENLYSLEIDHSHGKHGKWAQANLPEFTVYASEKNPWGTQEAKGQFDSAGVVVAYGAEAQTWTITIKENGLIMSVINDENISNGAIEFYLVIHDEAGNSSGSMYDGSYYKVSYTPDASSND